MSQNITDAYELGVYEDEDDEDDDAPSNPSTEPPLAALIDLRLSRRAALTGLAATAAAGALGSGFLTAVGRAMAGTSSLAFREVAHGMTTGVQTAPGYSAQVLIRWGDAVAPGAPAFDIANQSAAAQETQFGYNNDFMAYMPLPLGSDNAENGLLCISHEYTNPHLMWPLGGKKGSYDRLSKAQMEVEMAAHGHSVIEIEKRAGAWRVVADSRYNRRFTPLGTEMRLSGPAAGHDRLKTRADPSGTRVIGTIANCAGGTTPWGTVLIAEENFQFYFRGDIETTGEARNYKRYGLDRKKGVAWARHHDRFSVEKEPNEANRFGWVVEIDPYDPASTPVKRTALGRFKHEGATTVVNPDGRLTVYSGDDQRFDYLYRFVTEGRFDPGNREANRDLLDAGTLYAAKFAADGTMTWLPLVFGTGPLTAANGFHSQADVSIETRHAADLLGATPMDRPEDVETNPVSGRTYVLCTNNTKRKADQVDAANPRAKNRHGHVIELIPPGEGKAADHTATAYRWEFFLLGGNPANPQDKAMYLAEVSKDGWLSTPDNCTFDAQGRIWIATDGQPKSGIADSVYAADTTGPGRGLTRCFFNAPSGAEICGPTFTPDYRTLFVAIQHPGDDKGSAFETPSTRWPDFADGMPPRPSVVAITKDDGGKIGT
ncbi:MAG: PhoX family phosphatase [Proteobacteria bacterium]|nr:PhoX family phosphatase [Pseudomonadota bacterium]